jgi:hypothetical protein
MKKWIWTIIVIALLIVVSFFFIVGFALKNAGKVYTLEVPLRITVSTSNLALKPLDYAPESADIFIITKGGESKIPENCSLNNLYFQSAGGVLFLDERETVNEIGSRGNYDESNHSFNLFVEHPGSGYKDYKLNLDDNYFRKSKRLLSSGKDEFYIFYSLQPFYNKRQIGYYSLNYPKKDIDVYGCKVIKQAERSFIKINGVKEAKNINPQQIVCLRDNSAVKGQYFSKEKCTFFEISSDIEIKTEIDLKRGNEKVRKVPVF